MTLKVNEGKADRIMRIVVGAAIMAWGVWAQNWLGLLGLPLVVTGAVGFCGLYQLLGINTCPRQ